MTFAPHMLGIFADIYGSTEAMTIPKALLVALVGFLTVVSILSVIALFIKLIAFIFSVVTKKPKTAPAPAVSLASAAKQAPVQTQPVHGQVKLTDVDEPTAAVIMALVSHNSGIPIERLDFKSIKLLEDE